MVDTYAGLPAAALTESTADAQEIYVQRHPEVVRSAPPVHPVGGRPPRADADRDRHHARASRRRNSSRQQEEKLQFTSRLMTMGEMASSLAHELNQPLAAINNYCSGRVALVKSGRTTPDNLLPVLEKTAQQAVRAGMIIKRIREFVKRSEPKRQATRVADIVADAVGSGRNRGAQAPHPHRHGIALAPAGDLRRPGADRAGAGQPAEERGRSDGRCQAERGRSGDPRGRAAGPSGTSSASASSTRGRASTKRQPSACSNRFTAPSPMAWAWG